MSTFSKIAGLMAKLQSKLVEAGLSQIEAQNAVEYTVFSRLNLSGKQLEDTLRDFCTNYWTTADCLLVGFTWEASPEGSFWGVLYKELS